MTTWYVTVGQKYRNEPHLYGLHPDGLLKCTVNGDYGHFRNVISKVLGDKWAFDYPDPEFEYGNLGDFHPLGVTHELIEDHYGTVTIHEV